jgi:uncharacterized membrane protein
MCLYDDVFIYYGLFITLHYTQNWQTICMLLAFSQNYTKLYVLLSKLYVLLSKLYMYCLANYMYCLANYMYC